MNFFSFPLLLFRSVPFFRVCAFVTFINKYCVTVTVTVISGPTYSTLHCRGLTVNTYLLLCDDDDDDEK